MEKVNQEPVAWVADVHMGRYTLEWNGADLPEGTALYAAPQVAQPLKERPDFIAGYHEGMKDGKRCAERDAAPQVAQPQTDCRTCAKFVGRGDRCMSLTVCIGGDKYRPTQPVQQYGIGQERAE